ncbi:diphosphomevalonate decarboxylase [PVC group bacterium]|nr:diphosphomevalonate decarboxylase [PVC group bacterium]
MTHGTSQENITVQASPNLALIKYWGKSDVEKNLPATPSIGITLKNLTTTTTVARSEKDSVVVNDIPVDIERFTPFFDSLREYFDSKDCFSCYSRNNFPTSAGLASSSSGFAALAFGAGKLLDPGVSLDIISGLARIGSASAARAVFGGFVSFPSHAEHADKIHEEHFWPELRIVVVEISKTAKTISSRGAMERARLTSPFYREWCLDSEKIFPKALSALANKDLESLGPFIRSSYLKMFATMFSSEPPILYWKPESLVAIRCCEEMRLKSIGAWETMDAGAQVKIFCLEKDVSKITQVIKEALPHVGILISEPGPGPKEILQKTV